MSSKFYLRHKSFVCKASSGGQRRNPDFSRQNRHGFSRSRNRQNEDRESSDNFDDSEFLSTKNGPLLSLSNSHKSQPTATPGPREREIVELFRKVQAQLRERAAGKEEKKFEAGKEQNKESETVDSLLKLLRKHSVEQGKRKVNGGSTNELSFDRPAPRQSGKSNEEKSRGFSDSNSTVRDEPQETNAPSFSRPASNFRRRSPVPRVRYEPIVSSEDSFDSESHLELDEKPSETHAEPDLEPEVESEIEPDMDIDSGLELNQEEEEEEEDERELPPGTNSVNGHAAEFSNVKEDNFDEKEAEKQLTEPQDLNAMKLTELRALAKARGMKGFSKLKKSELVGLLSEDSI